MANNSIKGITIQIGGDTTKLNSALKDVNSKSKSLQSELKQVNNLLKLDPSNVNMLKQKMDLLQSSIKQNESKLNTYKSAYQQLTDKIKANGKATDEDKEQQRYLERQIEKTTQEIKKYERELDDTKNKLNSVDKSTDKVVQSNNKIGTSMKNAGAKSKEGWATVTTGFSSAINIAQQVLSVVNMIVDAINKINQFFIDTTKKFTKLADDVNTASKKFGIEPETYQKWSYASKFIDVSADTMGSALAKVTRAIGNNNDAFSTLGVTITDDVTGGFRSAEEVFYDCIDALGQIDDDVQRDIISNELFGKSFQELEPLVEAGSQSLKDLGNEAEDLNLIMDEDTLGRLQSAQDSFDKLESVMGQALLPIAEALAPVFEKIAKWLAEKLADPNVQRILEKIGESVGRIFEHIMDIFDNLFNGSDEEIEAFLQECFEKIDDLADAIIRIIDFILGEDGQKLLDFMIGLVDVITDIVGGISAFGESCDRMFSNASYTVEDFANDVKKNNGAVSLSFFDMLKLSDDAFKKNFGEGGTIRQKIDGFFGAIGNWFTSTFGEGGTISQSLSKVGKFFSDTFGIPGGSLWKNIGDFFSNIANKFTHMFDNVKIKLPHFNIKGKFSLDPLQIPTLDVKWYKKGGIFNSPSVIGVGEAGQEAVLPIEKLSGIIQGVFKDKNIATGGNYSLNVYTQSMTDAQQNALFNKFNRFIGQRSG